MKKTYVAIASFGSYSDREYVIIYAGEFEEVAKVACNNFNFPNDENNQAGYQTWENGVLLGYSAIIE